MAMIYAGLLLPVLPVRADSLNVRLDIFPFELKKPFVALLQLAWPLATSWPSRGLGRVMQKHAVSVTKAVITAALPPYVDASSFPPTVLRYE